MQTDEEAGVGRWQPMLEQVARERYGSLLGHALLLTHSRAAAEDLVQDALVATFAGRARFDSPAQAEAYVRRAISSRYIDSVRRAGVERRFAARQAAEPARHTPEPALPGFAAEVEDALARLSPRERACVVLRFVEDLSTRETAQVLRLSEGAVKRYVSDAVARLTAELGTSAPAAGPGVTITTKEVRRGS